MNLSGVSEEIAIEAWDAAVGDVARAITLLC